jgi:hypothetical protein
VKRNSGILQHEGGALPAEVNFFLRHTLQKPVIAFERRKDSYLLVCLQVYSTAKPKI